MVSGLAKLNCCKTKYPNASKAWSTPKFLFGRPVPGEYVNVLNDLIKFLHRGWITVRRSPVASINAVLTEVILSRIFHGAFGDCTVNPLRRKIAWSVTPTPCVFLAPPGGSGHAIILRSTPYRRVTSSAKSHVVAPPVNMISSNT